MPTLRLTKLIAFGFNMAKVFDGIGRNMLCVSDSVDEYGEIQLWMEDDYGVMTMFMNSEVQRELYEHLKEILGEN